MNSQVLTLTPAGSPLAQSLGFGVASVIVDNYTSSYVSLPDAGKTLPPWVYGAVVTFPQGVKVARAKLIPTVPAIAGPQVPVSQCTLTWTDAPLPQSAGHLLQQSQYATRVKLYPDGVTPSTSSQASFTVGAGATVSTRFTIPAGTVGIRILATAAGLKFSYQLLVDGHQTVEQYFGDPNAPGVPTPVPSPTLPFTIPVENDWDTQLDFTVVGDPNFSTSYFVSALFAPEAPGQAGSAQSVTIPTPAPWQAALSSATTRVAPGALNTDFTIVAALGSTTIYLHDVLLNTNSGSSWEVQLWDGPSANGVRIGLLNVEYITAAGIGNPVEWDGRGRPLTKGNALVGTLVAGQAASTIFGTYGYSQQ